MTHSFKLQHGGLIEMWEERYKNWIGNEGDRFLHLSWQPPRSGVPPAAAQGWGASSHTLDASARGLAMGSWRDLGFRL